MRVASTAIASVKLRELNCRYYPVCGQMNTRRLLMDHGLAHRPRNIRFQGQGQPCVPVPRVARRAVLQPQNVVERQSTTRSLPSDRNSIMLASWESARSYCYSRHASISQELSLNLGDGLRVQAAAVLV